MEEWPRVKAVVIWDTILILDARDRAALEGGQFEVQANEVTDSPVFRELWLENTEIVNRE
jgi:hypothetical protein